MKPKRDTPPPGDDFADLVGQAAQIDESNDQAGAPGASSSSPGEPAAPALTNAQCLLMAAQLVRETVCTMAKVESPRRSANDETLAPLAEAWAAVLDKHGINLGQHMGEYALELRAAGMTAAVFVQVRAELRAELEAAQAKAKAQADPAPTADQVDA